MGLIIVSGDCGEGVYSGGGCMVVMICLTSCGGDVGVILSCHYFYYFHLNNWCVCVCVCVCVGGSPAAEGLNFV